MCPQGKIFFQLFLSLTDCFFRKLLGTYSFDFHNYNFFFRDDKRQQMLKKDLEDANVVVQDMELELHKKASDLDSAKCEIESLQTVKQSLKTKLKECKR